jgi:L-asparaginase
MIEILAKKTAVISVVAALGLGSMYAVAQEEADEQQLPRVVVLATGGTIAGSSESTTDTTNYSSGQKEGNELVRAVPEIADVANVDVVQIVNVGSPDLTNDNLLQLSKATSEYLADDDVSGIVVTHGTSTAEDTALFLQLTVDSEKPIVVVGSMRPGTAISADGPLNLLQAISLAASEKAVNRGTMIVANDRIGSAMYTTKTNTLSIDTFKADEQGYLGIFIGTEPHFFYTPASVPGQPIFDISDTDKLPKVDILYSYVNEDPSFIDYAIENGAEGLVIAGSGQSSMSQGMKDKIVEKMEEGIPMIRASRVGAGYVSPRGEGIAAGFYNPHKARILLMLAINEGADLESITDYFVPKEYH